MKKIVSIILSVLMSLQLGITAFASEGSALDAFSTEEQETLEVLLSDVINDIFPQTRSSQEILLGEEIYSYEYVNGNVEKMDYHVYPIFINGTLSMFAYRVPNENGEYDIQLTEALVDELRASNSGEEIALLYDAKHCFMVTKNTMTPLVEFSQIVDDRDRVESDDITRDQMEFNVLHASDTLSPQESVSQRSTKASKSLSVPFVSQNPPSSICWAASMACIGNYLNSASYSAQTVAQKVYGSNWNRGATISTAVNALRSTYGISYAVGAGRPSLSKIELNINSGYPVYSTWSYSGGSHATVIRGYTSVSSIYVMDPEFGFTTATNKLSGFQYVSGYSGVTLTLSGYASKK
ncbi:C39 family peptidase [Lacrimispora saccharolytica]|nr:C39 family peptidase [Lacrimispora saccharolytica]